MRVCFNRLAVKAVGGTDGFKVNLALKLGSSSTNRSDYFSQLPLGSLVSLPRRG